MQTERLEKELEDQRQAMSKMTQQMMETKQNLVTLATWLTSCIVMN